MRKNPNLLLVALLLSLTYLVQLTLAQSKPAASSTLRLAFDELGPKDRKVQRRLRLGKVEAVILPEQIREPDGSLQWQADFTVFVDQKRVATSRVDPYNPALLVQIAEMDPLNPYPEVLLSVFTGGAHCCNDMTIFTSSVDGTAWKPVELEGFDGEATPFEQLNDDGIFRFVTSDNAFLYRFSSYADSYPPVQIWQLNADQFENISFDMRYRPLHSKRLAEMWNTLKTRPFGDSGINGTLAGYVATKAVLGELGSGWELMLKRYDRTSDTGLTECRGEYDDRGRCKGQLKRYTNFPAALRTFLFESGYIKSGN